MPPHVPQDIWNAVIESIDPDDVLSLRSCALVHPDWTPISRLCLARHRHISITGMDGYEQVLNRFLRSESMRPWLGGVKSLSFNPEFADWDDKRGYRFFHDFAGRLPNLRYLIIGCADWTVAPHHPSTFRMFSQFPSVTYFKMYQTEFPSLNGRALSSLPSLSTLVLYNSNTRWFPLPHHELWQNASPQKRPVLRVFRIRFDLTQEELDVLFHWLLQTPSRLSTAIWHSVPSTSHL
ncbi:hypothetical protein BD309DRAFT_712571 [Dichomitus squalens]|nr:hypothetical protein BD309DRAFT_712571 [Dichomitus squalens]